MVAKTSENVYTLKSKFVYIICFQNESLRPLQNHPFTVSCHPEFKRLVSFESVPLLQLTPCKACLYFSIAPFKNFILHFNVVETKL